MGGACGFRSTRKAQGLFETMVVEAVNFYALAVTILLLYLVAVTVIIGPPRAAVVQFAGPLALRTGSGV